MTKENTQLCPNCKTGADLYKLDSREQVCPYLGLHNGKSCCGFVKLSEE